MNPVVKSFFVLGLLLLTCSTVPSRLHAQAKADTASAAGYDVNTWFPFEVNEAKRTARVNLAEPRVAQYYASLFHKYFYAGNTRTWDDMLEELLAVRDIDFSVKNTLDYNSTPDMVIINAGSRDDLMKFLSIVHPVFASLPKLEAFIRKVDPSHIADGSHQPEGEGE